MTTLVSIAAYRRLTGDTTTADPDVTEKLTDAEQLVAEYLRRPLPAAERTERLKMYRDGGLDGGWVVYPKATPLDPDATTGYTVEGAALVGVSPDDGPWFYGSYESGGYATVTYTGGWTEETLPLTVAREIARTARALLTPAASVALVGATSARVGDIAVSNPTGLTGGGLDGASQQALKPYVRRRAA